jgi:putative acetyltransferase
VSLRPATQQDFDAIYAIYMDDSVNPFMLHDPMDKTAFQAVFDDIMNRDRVWVYESGHKILGMCSAIYGKGRTSHVAMLVTLAVCKDAQGQGVGRKLVKDVITELASDGKTRIELSAETDNVRGIAFYKAMDFVVEGTMKNYIKRANDSGFTDEIMMALVS